MRGIIVYKANIFKIKNEKLKNKFYEEELIHEK